MDDAKKDLEIESVERLESVKVIGGIKPPSGFKIEDASSWKKYKQMFDIYLKATGLANEQDERKIAIFLSCAGEEILDIYNGLKEVTSWNELTQQFDKYFGTQTNTVANSYKFFNLRQEQEENIEHFTTRLRCAAKLCVFKEEDRLIRDMLIIGVNDSNIKERLLREKDLDLVEAINICRAAEHSKKQLKEMEDKSKLEVHLLKEDNNNKDMTRKRFSRKMFDCNKCGKQHEARNCPAYGRRCAVCNRYNHYAVMCRLNVTREDKFQAQKPATSKKVDNVTEYRRCSDCSSEEFVVDSVKASSQY